MKVIDADTYSRAVHEYFCKHIEGNKSEIDILECNADLHRILKEHSKVDGWVPCEERYPDTDGYILLSFSNFAVPLVGRYEEDEEGGAFYVGDETESCVSQGIFVNAWQQLPECYLPEEETEDEN